MLLFYIFYSFSDPEIIPFFIAVKCQKSHLKVLFALGKAGFRLFSGKNGFMEIYKLFHVSATISFGNGMPP